MRLSVVAIAVVGLLAPNVAAMADPVNPVAPVTGILQAVTGSPDGWARDIDGSYKHAASRVRCPRNFKSFHFDRFVDPAKDEPNVQGICRYVDDQGRVGTIRVRQPGPVTDPEGTIAGNDKLLLATDGSAPPMLLRTSTDRKTGAARITVTIARNGYLVDCSVSQLGFDKPRGDFPLYCTSIPTSY